MSFAAQLPAVILDTVLGRLALLFLTGAGGDLTASRCAAAKMLATYQPDNEDELRLAAEIISFSFNALEALSQAASPDLSLNQKMRLHSGAVRLSGASKAAQKRLDQYQTARRSEAQPLPIAAPTEPNQPQSKREEVADPIPAARETTPAASTSGQTWTQAYDQRQQDKRLQARLLTSTLKQDHAPLTVQPDVPPAPRPVMTSQPEPVVQQASQR